MFLCYYIVEIMVLTIENIGTRKEEFRWQELTRDVEQYLPAIAVSTGLRFEDPPRTNWFYVTYADRRRKPSILILIAAFKSLSQTIPHSGH